MRARPKFKAFIFTPLTVHARLSRAAGRQLTGMQSPGMFIRVIP